MQSSELLQTFAEIAVAILGFTGVVAFLGQRAEGSWRQVDLFWLNQLLGSGFTALVFSFLPVLLYELGLPEGAAWRVSSGGIAAFIAAAGILTRRVVRGLPERERGEIVPRVAMAIQLLFLGVFLLQLLSAAGVVYAGKPAPVLVAIAALLGSAGFQFVRLLRVLGTRPGQ